MLALILGCGPLLPDELVAPGELPATRVDGPFVSLSYSPELTLSQAPASWYDEGLVEAWPDRVGDHPVDAHDWAHCGPGWVAATADAVVHQDGRSWPVIAGAVACDQDRVVATVCEQRCAIVEVEGGHTLGFSGRGADLSLVDGLVWWSDPELDDDEGGGRVVSERGDEIVGLPGEHLRRFSGPWVAGVFTDRAVPNRGRALHLGEPELVVAVERGSPGSPLVLAWDATHVAVGVPEREMVLNIELP